MAARQYTPMEKHNRERKRIADPTGRDRDRRTAEPRYISPPTFCFSSSSLFPRTAKNKKKKLRARYTFSRQVDELSTDEDKPVVNKLVPRAILFIYLFSLTQLSFLFLFFFSSSVISRLFGTTSFRPVFFFRDS